jgi:hypothetical protein
MILRRKQHQAIIAGMTDAKSRTGKGKPVVFITYGNG